MGLDIYPVIGRFPGAEDRKPQEEDTSIEQIGLSADVELCMAKCDVYLPIGHLSKFQGVDMGCE